MIAQVVFERLTPTEYLELRFRSENALSRREKKIVVPLFSGTSRQLERFSARIPP
jgi:hypothetical protein